MAYSRALVSRNPLLRHDYLDNYYQQPSWACSRHSPWQLDHRYSPCPDTCFECALGAYARRGPTRCVLYSTHKSRSKKPAILEPASLFLRLGASLDLVAHTDFQNGQQSSSVSLSHDGSPSTHAAQQVRRTLWIRLVRP